MKFILVMKNGKVVKQGVGLSFFCNTLNTGMSVVPTVSFDTFFAFDDLLTSDFQGINIQGDISYIIRDYEKVAGMIDFSYTSESGYEEKKAEAKQVMGKRITNLAKTSASKFVNARDVKTVIHAQEELAEFGKDDIVIAVGRDGLVCNTMKYLSGQKLIGVNPDPARWDGILLPFESSELEKIIPKTIMGDCDVRNVTMAKAVTNDGQKMLAVNDFFIGPKSHTSARYDLTTRHTLGRVITESQSSSGIIVSTGIGQTGWYKSVMAQAKAACGLFGYDGSGDYEKIGWDEKKLSFVVREPFPSNTTEATVVFGTLSKGDPFRVLSKMSEKGVIFSDGMEEDEIEFNSGVEVSIGMAKTQGCLVR